jgi:hypothetical protein
MGSNVEPDANITCVSSTVKMRDERMAQAVGHLSSKREALSPNLGDSKTELMGPQHSTSDQAVPP